MIETACIACTQVDDHPKHIMVLPDHSDVRHHHDCGTLMNPPCELCRVLIAGFPKTSNAKGAKTVTGEAARAHLLSLPPRQWNHNPDGSVTYEDFQQDEGSGEWFLPSDRAAVAAQEA